MGEPCTCARLKPPGTDIEFLDIDAACPRHGHESKWWATVQKRSRELAELLGLTPEAHDG